MLIETKNKPIINPATRAGASFDIALNPTGLRHISPTVCKKYVLVNHHGETNEPRIAALAGGTRIANAIPPNSNAPTNFAGLDGSRLPSAIHSHANSGARIITKSAGTNWNQLAGKSNPNTTRLVLRSANRLSDEPACS